MGRCRNHTLDRRSGFRDAYSQLADFVKERDVTVLACSATLTTTWLANLNSKFFEGRAKCLLHPIKREHVGFSISSYSRSKGGKDNDSAHSWKNVVNGLVDVVKDNVSIIFVDYQNDAQSISEELNKLNVSSRFMVGGRMTAEEKRIASRAFIEGEDNVLVATETYECGMHNENCSLIVRRKERVRKLMSNTKMSSP